MTKNTAKNTALWPFIAVVAGALFGGALDDDFFGAVVGALLAWLFVRVSRQEAVIAELRRALLARGSDAAASAAEVTKAGDVPARAAPPPAPSQAPVAAARERGAPAFPATAQLPVGVERAEPASAPGFGAAPAPTPAAPPRPGWLAPVKAWIFGGNTIAKLGVAILFIGLAFLARFASEHVHVPIEMRLATIGAAALALLAFGWRLRTRRAGYALVLQGAAVAVLFLTLFVAFRAYQLMPATLVFALMVLVAAFASALAVLQDSRALAVIGALGGFATPLLVSTGSGNHVALFAYYLVLDLGIAAVAWFKTWRLLNAIAFVATFGVGTVWGLLDYRPERYATSQAFLIAFFLIFIAILLLPARRLAGGTAPGKASGDSIAPDAPAAAAPPAARSAAWINGGLLFGLPTVAFALQLGLVRHMAFGSAISALVLAAFYVLLAWRMRGRAELAVTFEACLAIAVVFLTLVIPFALDARSTAGAWALEGAGLVWLGFRQGRRLARGFGYALLLLAGLTMLAAADRYGAPEALLNAYLFNGVMAVAGSLVAAHFVRRGVAAGLAMRGEALAQPLLIGWATLWALATTAVQVEEFVQHPYGLAAWLAAGSTIACVATALAVRLAWPMLAWVAALHAALLALATLDTLAALRAPWAEGGAWAWPLALAAHGVVLRFAAPMWSQALARQVVHLVGVLVLATLGALGGRAVTANLGDAASAWPWLGWLVVPALLLVLLQRPALQRRWPISAAPRAYLLWAAGALAFAMWLWTLLANALSNGAARPLPHLPLLNPLDLGVAAALVGVWTWLRSATVRELPQHRPWFMPAALGLAGFVWMNAVLIRAFHHYGDVPYRLQAWMRSLPVHTGITLLWAATALVLMWWATRRAQRAPWVVGAALLAAVVLKLMWVDLSGSGTVTRIVSFIGVGVLMLVIGYVAPLPAKELAKEEAHDART